MKFDKDSMFIDYLLVGLFVLVTLVLFLSLYLRSDFMMQWGIPGVMMISVSLIFVNYLKKIFSSNPDGKSKKEEE